MPIRRHAKIQAEATACDPAYDDYFRQRTRRRCAALRAALEPVMVTTPPFRIGWEKVDERNILSPSNIARLQRAFDSPDNIVFGFHYWYAGGQGHTNLASRTAATILEEIEASRPGDHFTLYSLRDVGHLADAVLEISGRRLILRSL